MPIGYLCSVLVPGSAAILALVRPGPRRSSRARWLFLATVVVNEIPLVVVLWLLAATALTALQGDLLTTVGLVGLAGAAAATVALVVLFIRGLAARGVLRAALADGLGAECRAEADAVPLGQPWRSLLLTPLPLRRGRVRRIADIPYGRHGRENRLDVYVHDQHRGGPTLVYLHGGGFRSGDKHREARLLLHRLAARGWMCVSANYRLAPGAGRVEQLADVDRAIEWSTERATTLSADPTSVFVAGSSAGGHLAISAALARAAAGDVAIAGVIALYAYYGGMVASGAPPCLLVHGDHDSLVPVEDARAFAAALAVRSPSPVVYAELPGAQHGFDLFRSPRSAAVVDAVEAFASCCRRGR